MSEKTAKLKRRAEREAGIKPEPKLNYMPPFVPNRERRRRKIKDRTYTKKGYRYGEQIKT